MLKNIMYLLLLSVFFPNCSNDAEEVSAVNHETSLTIKNGSADTIYYFAADQVALNAIEWSASLDSGEAIMPKTQKDVSHNDVLGYQDSVDSPIVVYWWKAEFQGGVRAAGEPKSILVKKMP